MTSRRLSEAKLWFVGGELLTPQLARRFAWRCRVRRWSTSTVLRVSADSHFHVVEGDYEGEIAHRSAHREPARLCAQSTSAGSAPGVPGVLYVAGDGLAQGIGRTMR